MRRGRAQPCLSTACQTTHNVVPTSCKEKNAQLNAQLFFFKKKRLAKRSAIFFLLLSVGLRGEVDPRESLPLKSPFLTAPVFRYIVRLAFASVKHSVLVRVHLVKRGFTTPPELLVLVPPTPRWEGSPSLILHCFFILFLALFWEGFSKDSGHSLGYHFQQKSEKRRLQCGMKRAYENGPGKNAVWEPFKP